MENLIPISFLNDFIFCPISIYFHNLDTETENLTYQTSQQLCGSHSHKAVDKQKYSSKKNILQAMSIYSEKYGLIGKIDTYDIETGILTERKRKITNIYDGYVFQVYAQCFALREMGYEVKGICLYSMIDNKKYPITLPEENPNMMEKFEVLIKNIMAFDYQQFIQVNVQKCKHCIYEELCYFSLVKGVVND